MLARDSHDPGIRSYVRDPHNLESLRGLKNQLPAGAVCGDARIMETVDQTGEIGRDGG